MKFVKPFSDRKLHTNFILAIKKKKGVHLWEKKTVIYIHIFKKKKLYYYLTINVREKCEGGKKTV